MRLLSGKNLFYYLSGLGNLPNFSTFRVEFDGENLILYHVNPHMLGNDHILQKYSVNACDILAFDIVKTSELEKQSVIGRGAVGGLLFGPVGAVLGGMSAAGKQKIKSTLAISYLSSSSGEQKSLVFDAEPPSWSSKNAISISKIKKELLKVQKSQKVMEFLGQVQNKDGSIAL